MSNPFELRVQKFGLQGYPRAGYSWLPCQQVAGQPLYSSYQKPFKPFACSNQYIKPIPACKQPRWSSGCI